MSDSMRPYSAWWAASVHGILQAKNTGVGYCALPQGIFSTQGWNPSLLHLLHWQMGSLTLVSPVASVGSLSTYSMYHREDSPDSFYLHVVVSSTVYGTEETLATMHIWKISWCLAL